MNERLKILRKTLDLTQQEFADRIGISRNNIATYETRKNGIGNSVIALICREFNVNEEWLRTGQGDMFLPATIDALAKLAAEKNLSQREYIALEKFLNLKTELREGLIDYFCDVAAALTGSASDNALVARGVAFVNSEAAYERIQEHEIEAEVESYRQQLILEKMGLSKPSPGTDESAKLA